MEPESQTRPRPPPLRLDHIGINPAAIVGKTLASVRQSPEHPALTLVFADGERVQICVDGYDPVHRGLPKALEMDEALSDLFAAERGRGLRVADCALITLQDKAFAIRTPCLGTDAAEDRWDQRHLGVAFKFAFNGEDVEAEGVLSDRWHCVWATLQEHDAAGACVFRTYDDVYLEHLQPQSSGSPRKAKARARRKSASPVKRSYAAS